MHPHRALLLSVFIVISGFFVSVFLPPTAKADVTSGLIARWNFEEGSGVTTADSSGNGRTGSLTNGPTWVAGKVGSGALQLDGSDDRVVAAIPVAVPSISVTFWMKITSLNFTRRLIDTSNGFVIRNNVYSGASNGHLQFAGAGGFLDGGNLMNNTWHHVVVTASPSGRALYIDGAPSGSDTNAYDNGGAMGYFYIGGAGIEPQAMQVDDVRIYDRVLTAGEVSTIFTDTGGSSNPTPDPTPNPTPTPDPTPGPTPPPANNHTWYLDKAATGNGNGSSWANAFTSVAAMGAAWSSISAGDTIWINGGNYSTEEFAVSLKSNISVKINPAATQQAVFRAIQIYSAPGASIDGYLNGTQYIKAVGKSNNDSGVLVRETTGWSLKGIEVDGSSINLANANDREQHGIALNGDVHSGVIEYCYIHHILVDGINSNVQAISSSAYTDVIIRNNRIFYVGDDGVQASSGNITMTDNNLDQGDAPFYPYAHPDGVQINPNSNHIIIARNVFKGFNQNIFVEYATGDVYLYNNIMIGNKTYGTDRGMNLSTANGFTGTFLVANNTFYNFVSFISLNGGAPAANRVVGNNLFINAKIGASGADQYFVDSSSIWWDMPGVQFYSSDGVLATQFTRYLGTARNVNPGLINPAGGDFRPSSVTSGVVNSGISMASYFTTDIAGNPRPQGAGWDVGAYEFVTGGPVISIPTLLSVAASSVGVTTATVNATLSITGGANPSTRGFQYGLTTAYGSNTTENGSFSIGAFSASLTSLTCNTVYNYRAFATNIAGTAYGPNATFTTGACTASNNPPSSGGSSGSGSSGSSGSGSSSSGSGSGSSGSSSSGSGSGSSSSSGSGSGIGSVVNGVVTPGVAAFIFIRDLSSGMTSSDVIQLQKYLNARGFTVSVSGGGSPGQESVNFGEKTRLALARFQAAKGIVPASGYFGPKTRAVVNVGTVSTPVVTAAFARNLVVGSSGEDVRTLQKYLNTHGFQIALTGAGAPGSESTYFGEKTKTALIRFQMARRILPADGTLNTPTRILLNGLR